MASRRAVRSKKPRLPKPDPWPLFLRLCVSQGLPAPIREHGFALPERRWMFDVAWVPQRVALEMDGGVWGKGKRCPVCKQSPAGRHTRGSGWVKDTDKLNSAAAMGWRLLRCTPDTLNSPKTFAWIKRALDFPPSAS